VFQRFGGQAKLGYVGIFDIAPAVLTMTVASKVLKNDSKIIISQFLSKSVTHSVDVGDFNCIPIPLSDF